MFWDNFSALISNTVNTSSDQTHKLLLVMVQWTGDSNSSLTKAGGLEF